MLMNHSIANQSHNKSADSQCTSTIPDEPHHHSHKKKKHSKHHHHHHHSKSSNHSSSKAKHKHHKHRHHHNDQTPGSKKKSISRSPSTSKAHKKNNNLTNNNNNCVSFDVSDNDCAGAAVAPSVVVVVEKSASSRPINIANSAKLQTGLFSELIKHKAQFQSFESLKQKRQESVKPKVEMDFSTIPLPPKPVVVPVVAEKPKRKSNISSSNINNNNNNISLQHREKHISSTQVSVEPAMTPVSEAPPIASLGSTPKHQRHSTLPDLPLPSINKNVFANLPSPEKFPPMNNNITKEEMDRPNVCKRRLNKAAVGTFGERSISAFEVIEKVGEGTFGHVFKARDKSTGELKALKKVRLEQEREGFPITAVREIKILKVLHHKNIVNLCEVITDKDHAHEFRLKGTGAFYLVFDYMDHDLYGLLNSELVVLSDMQIASLMKQLMSSLNFCHNNNFLHRDIKCSNILIDNKGRLKLTDFGLARLVNENDDRLYTNKVITLWYRPPELLLGEERYGPSVDVWSCGCILGELFTTRPMFQASDEMEQMEVISRICGTPNVSEWPGLNDLPFFKDFKVTKVHPRILKKKYFNLPLAAQDLLDKMLKYDPMKRLTAKATLDHPWLRHIDPEKIEPPKLPENIDCHELWSKERRRQKRLAATASAASHSDKPTSAKRSKLTDEDNEKRQASENIESELYDLRNLSSKEIEGFINSPTSLLKHVTNKHPNISKDDLIKKVNRVSEQMRQANSNNKMNKPSCSGTTSADASTNVEKGNVEKKPRNHHQL